MTATKAWILSLRIFNVMEECPVSSADDFLWIQYVLRVERSPDQARAASPWDDRDVVFSTEANDALDILNAFWSNNSKRHHVVHACCSAVLRSFFAVGPDLSRNLAA